MCHVVGYCMHLTCVSFAGPEDTLLITGPMTAAQQFEWKYSVTTLTCIDAYTFVESGI